MPIINEIEEWNKKNSARADLIYGLKLLLLVPALATFIIVGMLKVCALIFNVTWF